MAKWKALPNWRDKFPPEGPEVDAPLADRRRFIQLRWGELRLQGETIRETLIKGKRVTTPQSGGKDPIVTWEAITKQDIEALKVAERQHANNVAVLREHARFLGVLVERGNGAQAVDVENLLLKGREYILAGHCGSDVLEEDLARSA
jgi:hypothetical protein